MAKYMAIPLTDLETKFGRLFERRVRDALEEHSANLVQGGATRDDAFSTAVEYARAMGVIATLNSVLVYLKEAEDELFGRKSRG